MRTNAVHGHWAGTEIAEALPSGRVLCTWHSGGMSVYVPDSTWMRFESGRRHRLMGAPHPGKHTREILLQIGFSDDDVVGMRQAGVISDGWNTGGTFLPR
jgi:hypothetical protein